MNTGQKGEEPKGISLRGRISWHLGGGDICGLDFSGDTYNRAHVNGFSYPGASLMLRRPPSTQTFILFEIFRMPFTMHSAQQSNPQHRMLSEQHPLPERTASKHWMT